MFNRLQKKWKVNGGQVFLLFIIFPLGGNVTGYTERKLMNVFEIEMTTLFITVYIFLATIIWPLAVLIVNLPFGQFSFSREYISRTANRLFNRKKA
jgi:hypothetical protein